MDEEQNNITAGLGAARALSDGREKTVPKESAFSNDDKKKHRTLGLKLFDVWLYPIFTNVVVLGISIVATYLTSNGNKVASQLEPYTHENSLKAIGAKVGVWVATKFQTRSDIVVAKFRDYLTAGQAEMAKMVFFSFADGTLVAPFVKLFEDRREKIARWLDKKLGTLPQDESVYNSEPKQGWLSVIGGRLAIASIVVPTAVFLDWTGLNDKLFNNPGQAVGHLIEEHTKTGRKLKDKVNLPYLFKTIFFEAVYTFICSVGLYFSSRTFARAGEKIKEWWNNKHQPEKPEPVIHHATADEVATDFVKKHASAETVSKEQEKKNFQAAVGKSTALKPERQAQKAPATVAFGL